MRDGRLEPRIIRTPGDDAARLVPRLMEFERLSVKLDCVAGEWVVSQEARGVGLSVGRLVAAE